MTDFSFEEMYPDVLGAISSGVRVNMGEVLQCAPGIFPSQAYVNQPVELVLLVQNMVDLPVQVAVTLHLPDQDSSGRPLMIVAPARNLTHNLVAGEVGVFRMPMVVNPPSQPGPQVPIGVQVQYKTGRTGILGGALGAPKQVRPAAGAPPPTSLSVSPFKLQALREVLFVAPEWGKQADIMNIHFDIAPKRMPPMRDPLTSRYETLWTPADLETEADLLDIQLPMARSIASSFTSGILYPALLQATEERFISHGMPLETGEVKAIAKMLTYALTDVVSEQNYDIEETHWFQTLSRALAYDARAHTWHPEDIATYYLYDAAVYDAVLLAFKIIQPRVRERLGTAMERRDYARKVVGWLASKGDVDINYTYMPLVLGGVAMNLSVGTTLENPWIMIDQIEEAADARMKYSEKDSETTFAMLKILLDRAEDELVRAHITR